MPVQYLNFIRRDMLRTCPEKYFLFGDNCLRIGFKGQAAEMRNEPNAVGIRTKIAPSTRPEAYFTKEYWETHKEEIKQMIDEDFSVIPKGAMVVVPEAGLGTGLADLKNKCPELLKYINQKIKELE